MSQVDKILGPGNQYVTAAKMLLQTSEAMIAIDMPAGMPPLNIRSTLVAASSSTRVCYVPVLGVCVRAVPGHPAVRKGSMFIPCQMCLNYQLAVVALFNSLYCTGNPREKYGFLGYATHNEGGIIMTALPLKQANPSEVEAWMNAFDGVPGRHGHACRPF